MQFLDLIHELNSSFKEHLRFYKFKKYKEELTLKDLRDLYEETEIELTDDTRKIIPRSIYFSTHFAKPYLLDAIQKNPLAIFLTKSEFESLVRRNIYTNSLLILGKKIPDFYLGHSSSIVYDYPSQKMKIIAVTGTNGKTTTTFMIYHLWKKKNIPAAVIGTLGVFYYDGLKEYHLETGFTTPRSYELNRILKDLYEKNIFYVAMEASSEALSLKRLEGITITRAIFTNLSLDHLNFHKAMNHYLFAKLHLFFLTFRNSRVKDQFIVVYNSENFHIFHKFSKRIKESILYILESNLNCNLVKIQPQPYLFNQFNAICAYYATQEETHFQKSDTPFKDFKGVSGRMEEIYSISENNKLLKIYVDYAHTPDALKRVLLELKKNFDFIITVFGCGGDRDKEKRPEMGLVSSRYSNLVIITDDNPRTENPEEIRNQIIRGITGTDFIEVSDRSTAIQTAIKEGWNYYLNSNYNKIVILVTGKGHETYQIIGKEKKYFSDQEEIKKYISIYERKNQD